MIYSSSILQCVDNSGGLLVKCIRVLGKGSRSIGDIGDLLLVSIKSYRPNKRVKKGEVYKGVLVQSRNKSKRYGGCYVYCRDNCVVLLNQRFLPLGSRLTGPVLNEVRKKGYPKLLTLSKGVI